MENFVFDVADWFLIHESMTHKKLQKLCYYANAWNCALLDEPLFNEDIEAWVHGPVVPSLYREYSKYGWRLIPQSAADSVFTQQQEDVLNSVWNTYGEFSGDQLERLTHSEDPWRRARGTLSPFEVSHSVITHQSMKDYYRMMYEQSQGE